MKPKKCADFRRKSLLLDTKKGYHFERLVRDDAGSKLIALKGYAEVYSCGELKKKSWPKYFFRGAEVVKKSASGPIETQKSSRNVILQTYTQ